MTSYPGRCACGAVHYEIAAEPIRGFQCQCRDCQADPGDGKRKGFRSSCGSPLYNNPVSKPDFIGVYVGTLDDPSAFKPQIVMFASRGHAWDHLDPALPKLPYMRPAS